jgi:hypothetical protein
MPPDPFLRAHERRARIFDISTGLRPGTIRDQIIRGTLLATRAFERGVINRSNGLLVVGAGVAGAACATVAARLGVPTTLINDTRIPFGRQRACTMKRIEPTLYEWPAAHWDQHQYPWRGEPAALHMAQLIAADLAELWERRLHEEASRGRLRLVFDTVIDAPPTPLELGYSVPLITRTAAGVMTHREEVTVGMIVFAHGPGVERDIDTPDALRSFAFWERDPLSDASLASATVLISGGGDGALQDFLRAVFSPDVLTAHMMLQLDLDAERYDLYNLDQHATATFLWWGSTRDMHDTELALHHEVQSIVHRVWRDRRQDITQRFNAYRRAELPEIVLAHPCNHFHRSSLVNRFLTLLVLLWAQDQSLASIKHLPNAKLVTPVPCPHEPPPDPSRRDGYACYPHAHSVTCYLATCLAQDAHHVVFQHDECGLILLRHGVDAHPPFPELLGEDGRIVQQVLPAHLAHDSLVRALFAI